LKDVLMDTSVSRTLDSQSLSVRDTILNVLVRIQAEERARDLREDEQQREIDRLEELEITAQLARDEKAILNGSISTKRYDVKQDVPKIESEFDDIQKRIRKLEQEAEEDQRLIRIENIKKRRRLEQILMHEREVAFHKAKLHEQNLLLQLDQEREENAIKELERQKALELEREKTKELKFQMELEAEKKIQRDLESRGDVHSRKSREYVPRPGRNYRDKPREGENKEGGNEEDGMFKEEDDLGEGEDAYYQDGRQKGMRRRGTDRRERESTSRRAGEGKWERKQ